MIRLIYNLFWPLGLLFFLPGYLIKMFRRGGYRRNFGQRLGIYSADVRRRLSRQSSTWLHAVSVGEVGVALKLAAELSRLQPDLRCVLTTTTTTGFSFATTKAPDWIEVMYNPLDFWPIMRRALSVINPSRIVLIEAEVWPNLVAEAHARAVPLVLANARLSARSERRFHRFRFVVAPIFHLLDLVCVPETQDVARWSAIGVRRDRIQCTGSIKYDAQDADVEPVAPERLLSQVSLANRPVLLGGSTHAGEEELLGRALLALRSEFPSLLLIIAPRHVERTGEIRRALERLGLKVALQSGDQMANADCVLLDSTGELQKWYTTATVVFIGKSLVAHGGQNPVEAITAGAPVIFGPHMENFASLARSLVQVGGAIEIRSAADLPDSVARLLRSSESRRQHVRNACEVLKAHSGAAARTAKLVVDFASAH